MARFRYLNVGLAFVLAFIGLKMIVATWLKVPPALSLAVVGGILAVAVAASLWADFKDRKKISPALSCLQDRTRW